MRSEIAYDAAAPKYGGGTEEAIYFQGHNGFIYSLNAVTGALRWSYDTGNAGGPPANPTDHPLTWSSSPLVALDGTVYVGSANGYLYCFSGASSSTAGNRLWRVKLNASGMTGSNGEPIEATPTIGENGWIYLATRTVASLGAVGHVYAVDPTRSTANTDNAFEKIVWTGDPSAGNEPGIIAGLAVDACGVVYSSDFFSTVVTGFDGQTGEIRVTKGGGGKLCQAPALNRTGMLYIGTSLAPTGGARTIRGFKVSPAADFNLDWTASQWTAGAGAPGVFGDFFGGVLVRADSTGTTYLADANADDDSGAVYKFTSGSASMPGDWPTLGAGNRRQHKSRTYPYQFAELGSFYLGDPSAQAVFSVDVLGRAIGNAHGQPSSYLAIEWYGAFWTGTSPTLLGSSYNAPVRSWTVAGNVVGHVVGFTYTGPIVMANGLSSPSSAYPTYLSLPSGISGGQATDINTGSSIVGYSSLGSNPQVIRWDKSGSTWGSGIQIGAPDGGKAYAYALSDTKRISGKALFTVGGQWQGFTTPPGAEDFSGTIPLGAFGGTQSEARDVNDEGGTVGWAHKRIGTFDYRRAFLTPKDVFELAPSHELPGFTGLPANGVWQSEAWGVNCSAQVVGRAQNANLTTAPYRAFLRQPGAASLTDLTAAYAPSTWVLTGAWGISDAGHIVGSGTKNGSARQWMIYPLPQE